MTLGENLTMTASGRMLLFPPWFLAFPSFPSFRSLIPHSGFTDSLFKQIFSRDISMALEKVLTRNIVC